MFKCPYSNLTNDYRHFRADNTNSHVRILNASPSTRAVDIYANDNILVRNLAYREFSQYLPLQPDYYNIKVYPTGMKVTPLINTNINVLPKSFSTLAVIGLPANVRQYMVPEQSVGNTSGMACIRFVHLSPNTPTVDITSPSGEKIFEGISYMGYTDYKCIPPGRHSIQARLSSTNEIVLIDPRVNLLPNRYYSIYAIGVSGGSQPLQVLIAMDGKSYIP